MKTLLALSLSSALALGAFVPAYAQQERAGRAERGAVAAPETPQETIGVEPDEIDARAQDERAGLLLPAVQKYTGADGEPCPAAGYIHIDGVDGETAGAAGRPARAAPADLAPRAPAPEPCQPQATNFGVLLDGTSQSGGSDEDEGEESRAPGEAEITLKAPPAPND
ncbi:hypothetical protein E5163_11125 [Marinicauda algicola]|uniref:Uncharacterized protein n=1 Tax=Marinicauda algicola TaxID=2029849 RepID=A0A4S2GYV8_9PROT|nr:hypothetical protein [Marinicauda algicola]TGY88365.1 hypothetical protein E5163_11125 [Marinicauda algicola]